MSPIETMRIFPWDVRQDVIDRIKRQVDPAIESRGLVSRVASEEIAHTLTLQPASEDAQKVEGEPWLPGNFTAIGWPVEIPRLDAEEVHDFIGRYDTYADYYENWELICLAVGAAESFAQPLLIDPELPWHESEATVRELAALCTKHKFAGVADGYGKPDGSTMRHLGCCIDCWCQATGIDVPNPTGCWEIRTGAKELGWKNPRTSRPTGA